MSAVSMSVTPSASARCSTRTPSAGSSTMRIAPKPSRRTSSSPPSRNVGFTPVDARYDRDAMRIRWYGQSAFLLTGEHTVFIDPFGVMNRLSAQGLQFDYPPIEGVASDVLLVTHEHGDHNAVDV